MNERDLKPAGEFAKKYGVKMIGYGPPGVGKTPLVNTAPRPVMIAHEPGLLSMKGSKVPTFIADTPQRIDEFYKWFFESSEAKKYDTLASDSVSEMAEIYLAAAKVSNSHGLKAYGEMAEKSMKWLRKLYFMREKHVFLIAKQTSKEGDKSDNEYRPYFPGKELDVQVPHLYDVIAHIAPATIQGVNNGQPTLAIRCHASFNIRARNRVGLSEFEPPHLGDLFAKAMKD